MNNTELNELDTDTLQEVYQGAVNSFKSSLLRGRPWEEVQELRLQVSILGMALYQRLQLSGKHPAEYGNRTNR